MDIEESESAIMRAREFSSTSRFSFFCVLLFGRKERERDGYHVRIIYYSGMYLIYTRRGVNHGGTLVILG